MKHQAVWLTLASVLAGTLASRPSKAVTQYSDALTSPTTSDVSGMQSALTAAAPVSDLRGDSAQPSITTADQSSWGNAARFAAAYQTRATSVVTNTGISEGYLIFDSQAYAFNEGKDVIIGELYDITNGPGQSATVQGNVYVLGNLVRSASHGGGVFNSPLAVTSVNQDLWTTNPSPVFQAGPVSFTVAASLHAGASQTVQGRVWYDGTKASLSQHAGVTAKGSAKAAVWGANVGIGLNNVYLFNLGETLNATAQISPCNTVTIGESASLFLQALGGELDVFGSAPFGLGSFNYTVTKWPGYQGTTTLVNAAPTTRAFSTPCFSVPSAPSF